ncbi:MAG: UDP-N-acetylglucosamine diphosphorylase [Mogibacterium sp.]|nr:UDP-N-acetylglucosamine diphosphorylase [Mogibacterium sp.]
MDIQEYRDREQARLAANKKRLEEGVIFVDIYSAYIDDEVVVESGAIIANNVTLKGNTIIRSGASIGQSSVIRNSEIGSGTTVEASYIYDSKVGENTSVGPFAYIRPGSVIGNECKIGDFVEVKNATFGDGSKSAHLTYIGDADVGKNVNLGCGVVFVNYDGAKKYRSTIGDDCFIGCNTNIVSPVEVGDGAYIAAATTVTEDVPADALCIGRSRQTVKENWVKSRKILKKDQ